MSVIDSRQASRSMPSAQAICSTNCRTSNGKNTSPCSGRVESARIVTNSRKARVDEAD